MAEALFPPAEAVILAVPALVDEIEKGAFPPWSVMTVTLLRVPSSVDSVTSCPAIRLLFWSFTVTLKFAVVSPGNCSVSLVGLIWIVPTISG